MVLGVLFLIMQFYEYAHAISTGFTHQSGIYGNIFYFMTGFHGLHVLIGSVILFVMYLRMKEGISVQILTLVLKHQHGTGTL